LFAMLHGIFCRPATIATSRYQIRYTEEMVTRFELVRSKKALTFLTTLQGLEIAKFQILRSKSYLLFTGYISVGVPRQFRFEYV